MPRGLSLSYSCKTVDFSVWQSRMQLCKVIATARRLEGLGELCRGGCMRRWDVICVIIDIELELETPAL